MTSLYVVGFCMAICACAVMVEAQDYTWWRVEEYPNPLYQPQACGRHDNVKRGSWICDPNSIITPEDGRHDFPSGDMVFPILINVLIISYID